MTPINTILQRFREKFVYPDAPKVVNGMVTEPSNLKEVQKLVDIEIFLTTELKQHDEELVNELEKIACNPGEIVTGYVVSLSDAINLIENNSK